MTAPHPVTSRSCKGPRLGRSRAREGAQGMLGKDPASRIPAGMRRWNASGCCWRVPGAPCHPPRTQTKLRGRRVPMSCTGAGTQSHKRLHPPIPPRQEGQLLTSGSQPNPLSAGGPGEGGTRGRSLAEGRPLPLRPQPWPGAFHPEGFKALGRPRGRAAGATRDRGESETRHPRLPGVPELSLMFAEPPERRG